MDDDGPTTPVSTFKKRNKLRPSGSTSSLRSAPASTPAAADSSSGLSFSQDDGDDDESGNVAVIRVKKKKTPAGVVRSRERVASGAGGGKSRLSFGGEPDDDGEDGTVIKRSVESSDSPRRLLRAPGASTTLLATPALPTTLDQATISTNPTPSKPSIYSKDYLDQLKQSTLSTRPATHRTDYDALTQSKFGDQLDAMPTNIPTERAIAEAKDRRERIRREGGGTGTDGFISLEVGQVLKGGESRLVREEDELGDGDEDVAAFTESRDTLPLGQKANRLAAQKIRSGMIDLIDDAEEDQAEDEEGREWEEAQIRRGEQRRIITTDQHKPTYRPTPIPHASTLPSIGSVSSRLEAALAEAKASHMMDNAALSHFKKERQELDAQEVELREEVGKAEEKRRWFGDFKTFVEEVADFLDEKYPALEKVEADNLAIQRERAEIVSRRRFGDDADDVALFTGQPVPITFPTPPADNFTDIEALAPLSTARSSRRAARERRASADDGAGTDDELEPDGAADLSAAVARLREGLAGLFGDVRADDFRDPNLGIRRKFEEWRAKFPEEYANAFGGLAMVGVWEFWARVEMGLWNPFEIKQLARTPPGLDGYQWHANLSSFGHSDPDDQQDGNPELEDESEAVVNLLVTSTVIPRLEKFATSFDPLSARQTQRAVGVVDEVSYCVDKSSHRFEILIQTFMARIQLAITQSQTLLAPHLAALALPAHAFDPSTFAARARFARRQVRLLQNALKWRRYARSLRMHWSKEEDAVQLVGGGLLFDELIQRELVAKVILPVVEAGWATGGEEVGARVVELLPGEVPPALVRRLRGERG